MFSIDYKKGISITWGDCGAIQVTAKNTEFPAGSVLRLTVYGITDPEAVELMKDITVEEAAATVAIDLLPEDTRFCDRSTVEQTYRYDITLNPDTAPQTLVGHDATGPKTFTVLPKGGA